MIPFTAHTLVDNWRPVAPTRMQRDIALVRPDGLTMSSAGGRVGSSLNLEKIQNGILDGGSTRILPVLPSALSAVIPDPNAWTLYLFASPKP